MEYVEALKDRKFIHEIKDYLKNYSLRDYLFFVMGINMGLRLSELLHVKVEDVTLDGKVNDYYLLENGHFIYMNKHVKQAIADYLHKRSLEPEDYLFKSQKCSSPITRQQAYRIINKAAKEVGVPGKVGTHTLRKTFGYHAYRSGVAVSLLQKHFNHTSPSETLRYLGIDKHEKLSVRIDVNL
ncbi:tyrosine-type recombinase/integrase [Sutcliffiella horikoshii]|uniref:tyrosine-type recombinase/integrase n=1 Tax=Sutcliffiella horikoshii TaxID=79883 RepID=UPI001CBA705C|nr:tyrosine-type recombinase/integrase [Sutcliffiella horikoshii]UAL48456.1 tyrosine-type recombinase/integrase [Sutcliffiella horikoshii]